MADLEILHNTMFQQAIVLAEQAAQQDEVPVGAVLYMADGTVLAAAHNLVETRGDFTAHAELLCLQQAAQAGHGPYFTTAYLAVTLEPCAMCAQALAWARVGEVRYGAHDVKSGGVNQGAQVFQHSHHKPVVIGGVEHTRCRSLLQQFFQAKRG